MTSIIQLHKLTLIYHKFKNHIKGMLGGRLPIYLSSNFETCFILSAQLCKACDL